GSEGGLWPSAGHTVPGQDPPDPAMAEARHEAMRATNRRPGGASVTLRIGERWGRLVDITQKTPIQLRYKIRTNILLDAFSEMFSGVYEQFPEFLPRRNRLLVDVGCQFADYSIIANRLYGAEVVAFEPLKSNFETAARYVRRNKANVTLYNLGVSDHDGVEAMASDDSMLSSIPNGNRTQTVRFVTLDSMNLHPDLLKIDTEGFELQVLKGADTTIRKSKPRIIIETHSSELERGVRTVLRDLGYSDPIEGRRTRSVRNPWMDSIANLFFRHPDSDAAEPQRGAGHRPE
ncbi:Methyltransferase FkbM domain protein, partial [mine drainage metagenome]